VWSLICQLSAALAYCHTGLIRAKGYRTTNFLRTDGWKPLVHRDIKPANSKAMLLDESLYGCIACATIADQSFICLVLVQYNDQTSQTVFKLCDFGLGAYVYPTHDMQLSYGGTPRFIPPVSHHPTFCSAKFGNCLLAYAIAHHLSRKSLRISQIGGRRVTFGLSDVRAALS
jgi:serine/threonine protein kinase